MEDEELNVVDTTTNEKDETQTSEQKEEVKEAENKSDKVEFTEAQKTMMNKIIQERVERAKRAEARKYEPIVNTLKAGLGTDNIEELAKKTRDFYAEQGINIPEIPRYNADDEQLLAEAQANRIISLGYDEIKNTTDEMMDIGENNLTQREKLMYMQLAEKRKAIEDEMQLESIGVDKSVLNSDEFNKFKSKFNQNQNLKDIYELYDKLQPKENKGTIGSIKSNKADDGVKEFYSADEFDQLTKEQLNNPKIWEAVMKSKEKWI
jgi:hypothetical protein|nr:MAG TPA: hypothetical protein [Caudoviricetes sp.]